MVEAAANVLRSGKVNYWTGPQGRAFEAEFARSVEAEYAVACSNGTLALELALRAVGVGPGDEVVVTARTFTASATGIVLLGARPVFADVDPDSQNITPESLAAVITPRTRAVICVHLAGWPCDIPGIMEVAEAHGLKVIEDCAQAHGAAIGGRPVGALGHVAAWSFCQDKIMTTAGEGGMVTTNDRQLWAAAWSFKDHGKDYDTVFNTEHPPGFRWLHKGFGSNYRMTEVQSAVGRVLLRRLPEMVARRRTLAHRFNAALKGLAGLRLTVPAAHIQHSYYKYYAFLRLDLLKPDWGQQRIQVAIAAHGVPAYTGSCSEIYREDGYRDAGLAPAQRLPVARALGDASLMFLVHPTLTEENIDETAAAIRRVVQEATKG